MICFCRFNSKSSGAPPQLTIFYAGTVNVYNDISPEKVFSPSLSHACSKEKLVSFFSPRNGDQQRFVFFVGCILFRLRL